MACRLGWFCAVLLLGACASEVSAPQGPAVAEQSLSIRCVGQRADTSDTLADAQVFRLTAPLGRRAQIAIERGNASLFGGDESTARLYAAPSAGDNDVGRASFEREVLAELDDDGDLHIAWSDGTLDAGRTELPGLFEGRIAFLGEPRDALCWRSDLALPYRYDARSGACRTAQGAAGLNELPLLYVHETGDGECNDFLGAEISTLASPVYAGWNLRGASLAGASISFATMPDADFSGADLATVTAGYFSGNGRVDAHTKLMPSVRDTGDGTIAFGDIATPFADQAPYYPWRFACADRPLAAHCIDLE